EFAPVEARGLGGDESADDDADNEKDAAGADAAGGYAVALGLLIVDQLDYAPEDQQRGPVVGEQSPEPHPGKHVEVAHQEDDPEDNQHKRAGKRAAARPQRDKWRWSSTRISLTRISLTRARHCAPPR